MKYGMSETANPDTPEQEAPLAPEAPTNEPVAEAAAPVSSQAPLVLVIDDDRVFRKTLDYVLQRKGEFRVQLAEDGEEGVRIAAANPPDLVICDVMMRVMHGYATVSSLRANPDTRETPIIMLTGKGSALGERRAKVHGADYYLRKPVKLPELLKTIRMAIAKKQNNDSRGPTGWSNDLILVD